MGYPLENALFQWEEGWRVLQGLIDDPRERRRADRVVDGDPATSCAAGSGRPSPRPSWPSSTGAGTDWCLQVAMDAAPGLGADPQSLADAAFWLYLRGPRTSPAGVSYSSESSVARRGRPLAPARRMTIWSASMRTVTSRLPAQCSV